MSDVARNTGRTLAQIRGAPQGAVYVWASRYVWYPVSLAEMCGSLLITRETLLIETPDMAATSAMVAWPLGVCGCVGVVVLFIVIGFR